MTDTDDTQVSKLVERYIQLRDRKAVIKKDYEASVADIDRAMERVEAYLQNLMNTLGLESVRTDVGTVYTSVRTSATVADWDVVFNWIKSTDNWDALEHRVSKSFVDQYRAANDDIPPGINWSEARTVNIRRS